MIGFINYFPCGPELKLFLTSWDCNQHGHKVFRPHQGSSLNPTEDCCRGIVYSNCSSFPVQMEYYQTIHCCWGVVLSNCSSFRVQWEYYQRADFCRGIGIPNCSSFRVQWEYYQRADCSWGIESPNCSSFRVQWEYYRSADCPRGLVFSNCSSFRVQWEYYRSADWWGGLDHSQIRQCKKLYTKKNSGRWLTPSFHGWSNPLHLWQSRELQEQGVLSKCIWKTTMERE